MEPGVSCGTHSSERSSSHGCVELAMVVVVVMMVLQCGRWPGVESQSGSAPKMR